MENKKWESDIQDLLKESFAQNIPGGIHQCKNDPDLTLMAVSESFLSLFGYTREEVENLFHGKFMEMIYACDRKGITESIHRQLKRGKDIEIEYRVRKKDGSLVWILDKGRLVEDGGREDSFCCVLIENTDRKKEQEELRLSLERYQVIMDQATDIIFEWDILKDTLQFSSNWYKKFGYEAIKAKISERIPGSDKIHPEDMPAFIKIMSDTADGVSYSETEFRIRDLGGTYYWCRIRATTQYNSEGYPIKAIGIIMDIDAEKKRQQALFEQAQRDALTGLYNKAAIKSLVEQKIKECDTKTFQAILILDVDYFKEVNDTYGHLVGDSVLSNVASVLRNNVRISDLVGRIGGDEFLVYLSEITDQDAAVRKAKRLLEALLTIAPEKGAPSITCSIGEIVFQGKNVDFQELYKKADLALYYRKKNGRNGMTLYDAGVCREEIMKCGPDTAVGTDIVFDAEIVTNEYMAQYVFRTLYQAQDIESTVKRLLEIIGRSYDVSRVYIFENSRDGRYCSNTFEWCNKDVEPQISFLQNLSYHDDLADYDKNFEKTDIFYVADIKEMHPVQRKIIEPQGICSMLHCAMLDEGEFVGFIGFDECRKNRAWNAKQVAAFKLTADVFSAFIIKYRQKHGDKR